VETLIKWIGDLFEWIEPIASAIAVGATIWYYNRDNKPRLYTRFNSNHLEHNSDGLYYMSDDISVEIMNVGKQPTMVSFSGLVSEYTKVESVKRKFFHFFSKSSYKSFSKYVELSHTPAFSNISDLFVGSEFETLNPFGKTYQRKIKLNEFSEMMLNCVKTNERQQEQIQNQNTLYFHFVFTEYHGKEQLQTIALSNDNEMYNKIKDRLFGV